jgi:hypothetical protein
MSRTGSLFSQVLSVFQRSNVARHARDLKAEYRAKGFSSWDQFVSMLFCQLAQARSLREIADGLKCCEGKLKHLGLEQEPKRSTLSYANAHRPWGLYQRLFYGLLADCQLLSCMSGTDRHREAVRVWRRWPWGWQKPERGGYENQTDLSTSLQALTPCDAAPLRSPRPLGIVRAGPGAKRGSRVSRSGVVAVTASACRWWLAGLCCLSAPSIGLAEPSETQFSAQGHIVATNSLGFRGQYDFRVTVQGDRWLIESFTPGSSRRVIEVGSTGDGTILRVEHSPDGKGSFAIIESNTVPADAGGLVPLLYTFFCESAQLGGDRAGFLIPAYDPEAGVLFKPALRRFARWKKWDQGHNFFRWLAFYSSPLRFEDGSMLQNEVGDGCIAKFVILSMTNWNHQDLPCSGEYFRFQPPGTPLPTLAYGSFTVETVSVPANSDTAPGLPEGQPFTIVDRRLLGSSASNPVMCYVSRQAAWPSLARARHLFALQQGARRAPSKGSLARQAVLCGFATLPIIAFAFLVWHARAARNSPNIKKHHASTTT